MNISKTLLSLASPAFLAATLSAADLKTPFESLPVETVAAARFDNSSETLAKYSKNTKIGKLLLSDEKIVEYKAFVQKLLEKQEEKGAGFLQKLGEVGLELDDLYAMLTSHIGAAVVMQEVQGHNPMPTILVWAEMEQEIAERAFTAILEASAEKENIERTDLDLPGAAGARIRSMPDGSSFLVARLQNRFIFALGQVTEPIASQEEALVFEDAELNALGYFVQSQQGAGGGFLSQMYADAGLSSVRPSYETRFEAVGDVTKLLQFIPPQNRPIADALGLDAFTKFGIWSGFVDMAEKSTLFLGAPAPRSGIASLMDNDFYEFSPPAWVSSSANTYTSVAFDLTKVYDLFVATAKKFSPPEVVDQQIAQGNQQLQMMLQTDIPTLLSAFGKRAHIVEFPIEMVPAAGDAGTTAEIPRSPQVVVIDFTRPDILQAGLAMLSGMAGPNSGMELIDEQGFSGIRVSNNPKGILTVAHGLGKLVISIGTGETSSRVFSAMNNPPQGDQALTNDPELRSYLSSSPPKPSVAFSVTRSDKVIKNLIPALESMAKTLRATPNQDAADLFEEALKLFPSEEELEGVLGIGFTRMYHNEAGLIIEGVSEYK